MAKAGGEKPFWKTKPLAEMTGAEWESLCDGCARCCLEKLEDDDTGEISYTEVACSLLDSGACRCTNYAKRLDFVAECEQLTPENITTLGWIPSTCAYRLIAEGRDLYWWHPLVSGDPETVHQAGISVRGRAIPEKDVDNWEDHIVTWPK